MEKKTATVYFPFIFLPFILVYVFKFNLSTHREELILFVLVDSPGVGDHVCVFDDGHGLSCRREAQLLVIHKCCSIINEGAAKQASRGYTSPRLDLFTM